MNFRGTALLMSQPAKVIIAEPAAIDFRMNFLRVISRLRKSLFRSPGIGRL